MMQGWAVVAELKISMFFIHLCRHRQREGAAFSLELSQVHAAEPECLREPDHKSVQTQAFRL